MTFIDLYLLRYEWMKDLINQTGRTEDDFRRDVDLKLNMKLFDDLSQEIPIPKNVIQQNHIRMRSNAGRGTHSTAMQLLPIETSHGDTSQDNPRTLQELDITL